ncbi:MAG: four helix bundle protein [Oscillospiraceae bacterium]|nr:four helix bundle protein [Oscillospiraceae bacterium]
MRNDELTRQSMDFAVSIVHLVKELKVKHETVISNQVGRSGTSIGANIREAQYAHGKADFIAKLQIA